MPCLKWIVPKGAPKPFAVFKQITTVGAAGGNDVTLDAPGLADYHAQLVFDGRDFTLSEVDREGEIKINGKRKRRGRLRHGDQLQLGEAELIFSMFDEASAGDDRDETTQREVAGMHKISDFTRRLMEVRTVPEQLQGLLDAAIEATHARKGFVVLIREGEPEVVAARNLQQKNLPEEVRQLSDSIIRQVIDSRQPLIVSDALHDTMFRSSESVMNLKLSSVMCAPLITQGNLLGLIYLGNDDVVSLFDASSLALLTVLSGQAALVVHSALQMDALQSDRDELQSRLQERQFGELIGSCASLREMFRKVEKVAPADISVLITGETGTGKELVAREIHHRSQRAEGPFVVVNCGAIPENLMESELFGHVRGAFTGAVATRNGRFQQAHGGTLFLDEIGELPLAMQVKLLRALQERTVVKVGDTKSQDVDIRVVCATHRNLEQEIRNATFREDLYYRLNVVNLHLPPLRERGDDVTVVAKYLLEKHAKEYGTQVRGFSPAALAAMKKYPWPGNVRQLENRIKKAMVLCDRGVIGPEDLDLFPEALQPIEPLSQAREEFTRRYILEVLERNNGNRTQTARDLGVDPRTIFRYLEREPKEDDALEEPV